MPRALSKTLRKHFAARPMLGIGRPIPDSRNCLTRYMHETRRLLGDLICMIRDHVCDMDVDERKAAATTEYAGDTYYFCSQECKNKFIEDPEKYVSRTEASQT